MSKSATWYIDRDGIYELFLNDRTKKEAEGLYEIFGKLNKLMLGTLDTMPEGSTLRLTVELSGEVQNKRGKEGGEE